MNEQPTDLRAILKQLTRAFSNKGVDQSDLSASFLRLHHNEIFTPEGQAQLAAFDREKFSGNASDGSAQVPPFDFEWHYKLNATRIRYDQERLDNLDDQLEQAKATATNLPQETRRERRARSRQLKTVADAQKKFDKYRDELNYLRKIVNSDPAGQILSYEPFPPVPESGLDPQNPVIPEILASHVIGDLTNATLVEIRPNSMDMTFERADKSAPTSGYELAQGSETDAIFQTHGQSLADPGHVAVINEMGHRVMGPAQAMETYRAKANGARVVDLVNGIVDRRNAANKPLPDLHLRGYSYAMETVLATLPDLARSKRAFPKKFPRLAMKFVEGAGAGQKPLLDPDGQPLRDKEQRLLWDTWNVPRTNIRLPKFARNIDDYGTDVGALLKSGDLVLFGADQPLSLFSRTGTLGASTKRIVGDNYARPYTKRDRERNKAWQRLFYKTERHISDDPSRPNTADAIFVGNHLIHSASNHGAHEQKDIPATSTVDFITQMNAAAARYESHLRKRALPRAAQRVNGARQDLRWAKAVGAVTLPLKAAAAAAGGLAVRALSPAERRLAAVTPTQEAMQPPYLVTTSSGTNRNEQPQPTGRAKI